MIKIRFTVALLLQGLLLFSQSTPTSVLKSLQAIDSSYYKPGWANMDFTIPESPAFKLLGTDPTNILHPTSVKNIALSVGNYFVSSGPVIPKSLAVQFCPYLLANNDSSLTGYNKNLFLHRMSFSLGTSVQGSAYQVAEGLTLTVFDKTDLKANSRYLAKMGDILQEQAQFQMQAIQQYQQKNPTAGSVPDIMLQLNTDTVLGKTIDALALKLLLASGLPQQDIAKLRDSVKSASWNAQIMQIGLAVLQSSSDSLIKNLKVSQYGLWVSLGLPVFGSNGQFLFGAKAAYVDSLTWQKNYSGGIRFFYGGNNFKGFLQGEYDNKNKISGWTFTAGCQFNVFNGIWGQFAVNIVIDGMHKVSWQPGFNIGLGTGERKASGSK